MKFLLLSVNLPVWIPLTLSSLMQRKVRKRLKIEKSERWLGKSEEAKVPKKEKKKNSQIPSQDLKEIIRKVLCRHLTKVSLTMVVRLLLDYVYALLYLVFSIIYIQPECLH